MFEFILEHQLNIMLALCAICGMMAILLLITRFLSRRRKWILIGMELVATLLLGFDRAAYIYRGDPSSKGYIMVRLSNMMVFFLTSAIVLAFNLYLADLLVGDGKLKTLPIRLKLTQLFSLIGMFLAIVSHFTGLYYYFDENNVYHRGKGFLIAYIIPVIMPLLQYSVIRQYKNKLSRLIYISLVLYIFVPIIVGIIQIFTYGISIVNMAMVLVSISLYIFAYLDINDVMERAHEIELENFEQKQESMRRLFEQTATAFVTAIEKKDAYSVGHSARMAEIAKKIAVRAGRSEEECREVYYTALLHDVGMIGIPDSIVETSDELNPEEYRIIKQKPELSSEILSSITEYPFLSKGVKYSCERYDGSGYPDGLKGDEIPEISRIIAVADAFDSMTSKKRYRESIPYHFVRAEFVEQAGVQFDPEFADIMVHIMDEEHTAEENSGALELEKTIECVEYRENVSCGINVDEEEIEISFDVEEKKSNKSDFSAPSIILFDSYDKHVHSKVKAIEAYSYKEYGEVWFDGRYVSTSARNMEVVVKDNDTYQAMKENNYEIIAGRYDDHLSLKLISAKKIVEVILAIQNNALASYIGLTGENCVLNNIAVEKTGKTVADGDIKRIVSAISYIDRLEADLPNIQVDRYHSAFTKPLLVEDEFEIYFHSMSLPSASLVWHCPHIVLYYSEDQKVDGKGYREYALVKLNGECTTEDKATTNNFTMKKLDSFPGWDQWKDINKKGAEFSIKLTKKGNKIILHAENFGILIENTTILPDSGNVYVTLTGDQVALTDIRIH